MASRFLGVLGFLAVAGSCMAGFATYSYSPYTTYHGPSAALTYASHTPVYHQQPLVYQQALAAPVAVHAAPPTVALHSAPVALHKTVVAPAHVSAHYVPAPAHTYVAASTPIVKSVSPIVSNSIVAAPHAATAPVLRNVIYEGSPRYDFSYGVYDSITGDIKSQAETRDGGNVQGSYSVVDADGYKRTVTYTADDINGFNAVVQREPIVAKLAAVVAPTPQFVATAPVQHVPVQQQQFQYLPQAPVQAVAVEQQPQQLQQVQQPEQVSQQYPQDQRFPPYPQYENPENSQSIPQQQPEDDAQSNDDSEVIEARTAADNNISSKNNDEQKEKTSQDSSLTTASPAPVTEDQKENEQAPSSTA